MELCRRMQDTSATFILAARRVLALRMSTVQTTQDSSSMRATVEELGNVMFQVTLGERWHRFRLIPLNATRECTHVLKVARCFLLAPPSSLGMTLLPSRAASAASKSESARSAHDAVKRQTRT